jgi:ribosomal protein S18 acetylase RimI-like enzyme
MKIELKKISNIEDLENIRELYCTAFPPEERREFEDLEQLVFSGKCIVYKVIALGEKLAGFCIFWVFDEFIFIEHLAVNPELRSVGIGEEILSVLRKNFKLIILEIEIPVDKISQRRVRFYERNGFTLHNQQYFQPSYGKEKPEVELKIMSSIHHIPDEKLKQYLLQIRKKVYRQVL